MNQHATADTPVTYPRRHGCDQARARRSAALFLRQVPGAEQVSVGQAEWDLYGRGLVMGDPLADDVVAWMRQHGQAEAWKMVNAAIERGLPAVPAAPPPLRAFISHVEARPDWVRDELLIEGARVCHLGGLAAMRALPVTGLMAGYQPAAVSQTLLGPGALDRSGEGPGGEHFLDEAAQVGRRGGADVGFAGGAQRPRAARWGTDGVAPPRSRRTRIAGMAAYFSANAEFVPASSCVSLEG